MILKIILILIMLLLAIIGLFKPQNAPRYMSILSLALLMLIAASQIIIEIRQSRTSAKKEAIEKVSGVLKPRTKILLSSKQNIIPKLEIADTGSRFAYSGKVVKIFDDSYITIIYELGQMKLSTLIRNQDGVIVAEIIDNEWKINPQSSWDRNYSDNALEVKDSSGDIILQVRLKGDTVQFQGKFYDSKGNSIGIGKIGDNPNFPGGIQFGDKKHPLTMKIEPVFKYPSNLHLGELRDKR